MELVFLGSIQNSITKPHRKKKWYGEGNEGKGYFLQQMVLENLDIDIQKNGIRSLFYTIHKNNPKQIKNPNIKPETIKRLEENRGGKFVDKGLGSDFWHITLEVQATRAKQDKWDYIKLKNFCETQETIN